MTTGDHDDSIPAGDPLSAMPGLAPLVDLLTSEGTSAELAGEAAVLDMFRASAAPGAPAGASPSGAGAITTPVPFPGTPALASVPAPADAGSAPAGTAGPAGPAGSGQGGPPRRPDLPARWRRPGRLTAAALLALAAGLVGAAYTADLPAPVQHVAYQALHFAGVPDSPRSTETVPGTGAGSLGPGGGATSRAGGSGSGSSSAPAPGQSAGPAPSTGASSPGSPHSPGPGGGHGPSPGRSHSPSPSPTSSSSPSPSPTQTPQPVPSAVVISGTAHKITAGGSVSLTATLTDAQGGPVPGRTVTLTEHVPGRPGWQPLSNGVTGSDGTVTVAVPSLTTSAGFRFEWSDSVLSGRFHVTVIPAVSLSEGPARRRHYAKLAVSVPSGQPGDLVVVQVLTAGHWHVRQSHALNSADQTAFQVPVHASARSFRVVLQKTASHGASVSAPVTVPAS
jgi:hypothetical protein